MIVAMVGDLHKGHSNVDTFSCSHLAPADSGARNGPNPHINFKGIHHEP